MGTAEIFLHLRQKTTKWSNYFAIYDELLGRYVGKEFVFVEIGVLNGGSLRMWREFFGKKARIIGIDINPVAKMMEQEGFEIFIGDQASPRFWTEFMEQVGPIDVLLDDGGHTNRQQIMTVKNCVAHIRDGGLLLVEDVHASYMASFGNPSNYSFMNFAKKIADEMNRRNPYVSVARSNVYAHTVHAVTFFDSIVCFHVNREFCQRSRQVNVGTEEIGAIDFRDPVQRVFAPENRTRYLRFLPDGFLKTLLNKVMWAADRSSVRLGLVYENTRLNREFDFR